MQIPFSITVGKAIVDLAVFGMIGNAHIFIGEHMANHASALKRERQGQKRRMRNRSVASAVKTAVKKVAASSKSGNLDAAKASFISAVSALDGAASKGVIPKNRASRKVSRMARAFNKSQPAAENSPSS
jgi:small subunit ribosomal protein S20